MVWWKHRGSSQYPCCGTDEEDKPHITRCTQEAATIKWNTAIKALTEWMKDEQTDPHLTQVLIAGLQVWHNETSSSIDLPATRQQSQLSWDAALDGWLGMEWRVQQAVYWAQWQWWKSNK